MTPAEYLKGGSRSIILNVAAFFLGFKSYNLKFKDHRELLGTLFGPENNSLVNEIYDRIKGFENQGISIEIINAYSSLKNFILQCN